MTIEITYNDKTVFLQGINTTHAMRLLRIGGIDVPNIGIRRLLDQERPPADAELLTIDEAIEVLR